LTADNRSYLLPQEVRRRYNSYPLDEPRDAWHRYTKAEIDRFLEAHLSAVAEGTRILDAGCGSAGIKADSGTVTSVDIADRQVLNVPRAAVATVEALPFTDSSFGVVVCVGSVLNYCDAASVIRQIARVLATRGTLILEFESSRSLV
jgi:SAM-dependent methyltransferase